MANSDPHFSNIFDIAIIEHLKGDPEKMPPDEHFRFYAGICNLLPLQPPGKKRKKKITAKPMITAQHFSLLPTYLLPA